MNVPDATAEWQRLHPLTPILRLSGLFYAALAAAVFGALENVSPGRLLALWPVALLFIAPPIVVYLRFRYRVTDDGLVIHHGVLVRRRRVIPRSRIQNVDLSAGLVQQLVGVVAARIETAGGQESEAALRWVSRAEGRRLRDALVSWDAGRERAAATGPEHAVPPEVEAADVATAETGPAPAAPPPVPEFTRRLGLLDLAIAGATSNRAGVLVGVLLGSDFFLDFMPTDWLLGRLLPPELLEAETAIRTLIDVAQQDLRSFLIGSAVVGIAFGLAGWLASVVLSTVRYFNFRLDRRGGELRVGYGLLTRREQGFRRHRVQNVQIEESVLRRWLGLAALRVQTAGYGPGTKADDRMEMLAPIARRAELPSYLSAVFDGLDWDRLEWRRSHPRARRRLFIRRSLPVLLATPIAVALLGPEASALLLLLAPAWLMASLHYRHLGHARLGPFVLTREGFWTRRTYIVPVRKVQALRLGQTPFQLRLGLATLTLETAGNPHDWHSPRSVDVGENYGRELLDELAGAVTATGLTF